MIGALHGKVTSDAENPAVVDINGVGYLVHLPNGLVTRTIKGQDVSLFIHTHVQDDAIDLYGFASKSELHLFSLLLGVPGIGPKTALSVVDRGEDAVRSAVITSDVGFFSSVPRLGKKNAQKIIIELKTKLGSIQDMDLSGETSGETAELMEALESMGFSKDEIRKAMRSADATKGPMEQRIKHALRFLSKGTP
jgi:Holliday junction DNA helicase RuvA